MTNNGHLRSYTLPCFGAAGFGLWGFSAMAGDDRGLGVLVVWLTIIV